MISLTGFFQHLEQSETAPFRTCILKEKFLKKNVFPKECDFYMYASHILMVVSEKGVTLSVHPEDQPIGYRRWFRFIHTAGVLQENHPDNVKAQGNKCFIRGGQIERVLSIFTEFCHLLENPREDRFLGSHHNVVKALATMGWSQRTMGILPVFFEPTSMEDRKFLIHSPVGQVVFNEDPHLPYFGEKIYFVSVKTSKEIVERYSSNIDNDRFMRVEGDTVYAAKKWLYSERRVRRFLFDIFSALRDYPTRYFEYEYVPSSGKKETIGRVNPYDLHPYMDVEDCGTLENSIFPKYRRKSKL